MINRLLRLLRQILHVIWHLGSVLPLQVVGIAYLPFVVARYQMGQFPNLALWFDDRRGRYLAQFGEAEGFSVGSGHFGREHTEMYLLANQSWWGRYAWTAFRNPVNYFQHEVLGYSGMPIWTGPMVISNRYIECLLEDGTLLWEYSRMNGDYAKIPFIPYGIRVRLGYKLGTLSYVDYLLQLGIPMQSVVSVGIRRMNG